jgi:hypothetical protein
MERIKIEICERREVQVVKVQLELQMKRVIEKLLEAFELFSNLRLRGSSGVIIDSSCLSPS